MTIQQYSVNQHPIQTLLTWIHSGEIAIPEIQRPFVWNATKVRDFMDSLYQGYPVGYLIAWRNPNVKLKDGTTSDGKRILIDGQQRVTALMAALLGQEIINSDYRRTRIRIAFSPQERVFEVSNSSIQRNKIWISDIAEALAPDVKIMRLVRDYCQRNPEAEEDAIYESIERLRSIVNNHIGLIELNSDLDIETVTEIFIRINSQGVILSQADFAMSKIAANEVHGGPRLRKCIDYFCHLAIAPEFYPNILDLDNEFAATEHFQKMSWLKNENDDLYDPSYTDMLRVAFTSEFKRGRLEDLVALLSGRNFETRIYEEEIVEQSFIGLERGLLNFMSETNFKRFVMIIKSAGFVEKSMIRSQNALNFAYIAFLVLRSQNVEASEIEPLVRRWYVMSVLTGRYSGAADTTIDLDIRRIEEIGLDRHLKDIEEAELSTTFWTVGLPQDMNTSVASSPYYKVYLAAQVTMNDKGFLSKEISVRDLITHRGDIHHVFPRNYLKGFGRTRSQYNQIANYVMMQSEINISVADRAPADYFSTLLEQCRTEQTEYGGITDLDVLRENLAAHCIPGNMEMSVNADYEDFLLERRRLISEKIRAYYLGL